MDISFLENEIRRHRDLYYNGTSEISDIEFDALEDSLRAVCSTSSVLKETGAPISTGHWEKSEHPFFMGSLAKVKDGLDFKKWVQKVSQ